MNVERFVCMVRGHSWRFSERWKCQRCERCGTFPGLVRAFKR